MPRQNRVTPFGQLIEAPVRGTFMGNRGQLHDDQGNIRRPWQVKRWIVCLLQFRGRKRQVMAPGQYTELFFLDEATAFAAGHRPCAECRRGRFNDFRRAWSAGAALPSAPQMDDRLHAERVAADKTKRTFVAALDELPGGTFVTTRGAPEQALLLWGGRLLAWSPGGYGEKWARSNEDVIVLTPASTVAALRAGYLPDVHPSAG